MRTGTGSLAVPSISCRLSYTVRILLICSPSFWDLSGLAPSAPAEAPRSSLTSLIVYQGSVTVSSSAAILPTTAQPASSSSTHASTGSTTGHSISASASSSSSGSANAPSTASPTTKSKSAAGRRISWLWLGGGGGGGELAGPTAASIGALAMLKIAGWL